MTQESEQFEAVLDELRGFVSELRMIGVSVMIVGGQVIALESRALGGDGTIEVTTPTGVVVRRGFSMEPDLLFDVDEGASRSDAIIDVLKRRGFKRVRTFRWRKELPTGDVDFDLFVQPDSDEANNPAGFTRLPAGDVAALRPRKVRLTLASGVLEIAVPDPVGFLAMKIEAKRRLRPKENKDSFDLYAYIAMKGADVVGSALRRDGYDGPRLVVELVELFNDIDAPGVLDVVSYAGTLQDADRALLARAVVDLMLDVKASFDDERA